MGFIYIDLQKIAQEYQKLSKKRFEIGLENGEQINLSFKPEYFYHLLGFPKFECCSSIVKMVENDAMYKENFYKAVLKGNIKYDDTNFDKLVIKKGTNLEDYYVDGKWSELANAKNIENVDELNTINLTVNNRFNYFTYQNIIDILQEEVVAIYDKTKSANRSKIDANKLFFHFMMPEGKNLNLFTTPASRTQDAPVSFFLEQQYEEYLKTNHQSGQRKQDVLKILYRVVYTNGTEIESFNIFWDKVRFYHSAKYARDFNAHIQLRPYFENGQIIRYQDIVSLLDEIARQKSYQLEIIKNNKSDILIRQKTIKEIKKLDKTIKTLNQCKNRIRRLEVQEIKYVYSHFIQDFVAYPDEFIIYLIKNGIYKNNYKPKEIRKLKREFDEKSINKKETLGV